MINLINGSLQDPQENIQWVGNKNSATIILNTHLWKEGEVLVVGYKDRSGVIIGLGVKEGVGPECYRIIVDGSVYVVSEVLMEIPDVSYYSFDQRYLIKNKEGELIFTRRYVDYNLGEVKIENIPVTGKCIITESSTGGIWLVDPPRLINLFSLTNRPGMDNLRVNEDGQVMIDLVGSDGKVWKDLCFISSSEREYLSKNVFEGDLEISVTHHFLDSGNNQTTIGNPHNVRWVIFELTSRYQGKLTDLTEVPKGWIKDKNTTGSYTMSIPTGSSTSFSTGQIVCILDDQRKVIDEVIVDLDKLVFIFYSQEEPEEPTQEILTSNLCLGDIQIYPPEGSYTWFAFPKALGEPRISQIGVNYVIPETKTLEGVKRGEVNLGDYTLYRSLLPGNGKPQEIRIWKKQIPQL